MPLGPRPGKAVALQCIRARRPVDSPPGAPGGTDNRGPATPGRRHRRRTPWHAPPCWAFPASGPTESSSARSRTTGPAGPRRPSWRRSPRALRAAHLRTARDAGIDVLPVGDFALYDHVLDTAELVGIVAERHGGGDLAAHFRACRGADGVRPLELTKWLDTNYHYLVPELRAGQAFRLSPGKWLAHLRGGARARRGRAAGRARPAVAAAAGQGRGGAARAAARADRGLRGAAARARRGGGDRGAARRAVPGARPQRAPSSTRSRRRTARWPARAVRRSASRRTSPGCRRRRSRASRGWRRRSCTSTSCARPEQLGAVLAALPAAHAAVGGRGRRPQRVGDRPRSRARPARPRGGRARERAADDRAVVLAAARPVPRRARDGPRSGAARLARVRRGEAGRAGAAEAGARRGRGRARRAARAARATAWRRAAPRRAATTPRCAAGSRRCGRRTMRDPRRWPSARTPSASGSGCPSCRRPRSARSRRRPRSARRGAGTAPASSTTPPTSASSSEQVEEVIREQEALGLDVLVHGEPERNDMVEYFGERLSGFAVSRRAGCSPTAAAASSRRSSTATSRGPRR